jgi:hypothetical protein
MSRSGLNFGKMNETVQKIERQVQSLPLWIQLVFLAAAVFVLFSEIVVSMIRSP